MTQRRTALQGMSGFVRAQLAVFGVLTVIGVLVMAVVYVQVPALFGIGRYRVTVQLAASGGLYPHANVSYRGETVGTVRDLRLTPAGVEAELSIDSDRKIPADSAAAVRSVSAIGEQYLDLVPAEGHGPATLGDGAVIPVQRTTLPQDVGPMLDQADRLLAGLAHTRLQAVVDEAFRAFDGSGPDLARLLDSARLLVQEAEASAGPTATLIDQLGPLLDTQRGENAAAVRGWTKDLATVTDQLRARDPRLRSILHQGPGAADEATALFQDLKPTMPLLVANLASVGQVTTTYLPGIEQILVVFPPLIRALITAATGGPVEEGAMVDFLLELNDPPPCTTGFLPPSERRSPVLLDAPPLPNNLFCKVGAGSPIGVRGVRNSPCMEVPGKRAPTPEACRGGSARPARSAARPYDPKTGAFVGPDGRAYRQPGQAPGAPAPDWKTMMTQQQGR